MAEIQSPDSKAGACRIVVHAGFTKCGSSSIQAALFHNVAKLREGGIYVFDKDLKIAQNHGPHAVPHQYLMAAKKRREDLTDKLAGEIEAAARDHPTCACVLSAESLSGAGMAQLFAGLDRQFAVSVVFYARPQWQWIPSAWQQWRLKKGLPLDEFVSRCLQTGRPPFRARVEEWQKALPAAKLHVRFLIREMLAGGNPARDFFNFLGASGDAYEIEDDPRNTSLDFAVLHVLSQNPDLFSSMRDKA